jgi:glutathione S-transferase
MSVHRLFGSELSPYSVKVRSYFRYKKIPHEWVLRSSANQEEFQRYAKLPLIPLVVTPEGQGLQDSTPILEHFEKLYPEPSIHPGDPALAFLSALVEEYADEWGNKPMFHYRWTYELDQQSAAERIARQMMPGLDEAGIAGVAQAVKSRMIPRLKLVGSSAETRGTIEGSYLRQLDILEKHLASRKYLFGARAALADFGLYAQIYECSTDPTPGAILRERAPRVLAISRAGTLYSRRSRRSSATRSAPCSSRGRSRTRAPSQPARRRSRSRSRVGHTSKRHRSITRALSRHCERATRRLRTSRDSIPRSPQRVPSSPCAASSPESQRGASGNDAKRVSV